MNLLKETKQHYFFVMIIEFVFLSCVYWLLFSFNFSHFLVYLLALIFYFTSYKYWINILIKKENLLLSNSEHFTMISTIMLLIILLINSITNTGYYKDIIFIYGTILIIFIAYYIYRIKKQKKSQVPVIKFSSATKFLATLSCLFLVFDFYVYNAGKFSIQLILYIPFLFLILSFLLFIYKKVFEFKSLFALILFCNIYMLTTFFLVLNYISNNLLSFTLFFHFVIFLSISYLLIANSKLVKEDFLYSKEFLSLISVNILLIFLYLTNILSFTIPPIIISYIFFVAILLITYLAIYNYKNYIN
ncbi:hypothetical protein [Candidatus Ruminimicrobiellum ovillum]|uniref:hypothetical protein n=1 Tax=Candidatus Ruminimicrobiellum ovillum TaxID=1947927 RepID=UPI00355AA199